MVWICMGQWIYLATLTLGKDLEYPLDRRLGGSQSRSGPYEQANNLLNLSGTEPPSSWFVFIVSQALPLFKFL
jgi:hypothetical protein